MSLFQFHIILVQKNIKYVFLFHVVNKYFSAQFKRALILSIILNFCAMNLKELMH